MHNDTIGLISLDSDEAHNFGQEHLNWVQALADEIAVVIQNARLYEQVQEHASELEGPKQINVQSSDERRNKEDSAPVRHEEEGNNGNRDNA